VQRQWHGWKHILPHPLLKHERQGAFWKNLLAQRKGRAKKNLETGKTPLPFAAKMHWFNPAKNRLNGCE
jgi:hypothetical protein